MYTRQSFYNMAVNIFSVCKNIQLAVRNNVEQYTSIHARRINILVKNLRR